MSVETTATIASFGGKLLKLAHKAASTNCEMKFNLFLPPQALKSSAEKIPVLIYLSGLTCTGDNCSEKGFFQHRASQKGIAVVYPDTSPSTYPPTILNRVRSNHLHRRTWSRW
jgi:S-formylglutathione hydrolase